MSDPKNLLLSALRSAVLRAELDANELKTIGTALKCDAITPAYALVWLQDVGLIQQVKGATLFAHSDTGFIGNLIERDTGAIISGKQTLTNRRLMSFPSMPIPTQAHIWSACVPLKSR